MVPEGILFFSLSFPTEEAESEDLKQLEGFGAQLVD